MKRCKYYHVCGNDENCARCPEATKTIEIYAEMLLKLAEKRKKTDTK